MIKHSPDQLEISDFMDPYLGGLNPNNRWIIMAKEIPWSQLKRIYERNMSFDKGARPKPARLVIGALIIKHKYKLSDRETIEQIKESPYLQYFVGLHKFQHDQVFDSSLFPTIRKRLTIKDFNDLSHLLQSHDVSIDEQSELRDEKNVESDTKYKKPEIENSISVDATVAVQEIPYPTDLALINKARIESEKIIDILWEFVKTDAKKPRSYRQKAQKEFLALTRKKKKGADFWRAANRKQLQYLHRNIGHIHRLLDQIKVGIPLNKRFLKLLYVIQEVYRQQMEMIEEKKNTVGFRIVNLYQPHIRPIIRGKSGANVEFGAKISISIDQGYSYIDHHDFEAYYEGEEEIIKKHIEAHKLRHPHTKLNGIVGDKIYGNRNAREVYDQNDITFVGSPLGAPPKDPEKIKEREENKVIHQKLRSHVEGKFGQTKRGYGLNNIKARRSDTTNSWIGAIFFIANLERFMKGIFFDLFFIIYEYDLWALVTSIIEAGIGQPNFKKNKETFLSRPYL
ncbi:IS5 family transposase [Persicobacter diffluens]|uniref:Transposase n=2 Tax=Persicobacter diffluens TaxID=981 RepID=A0AAN5ANK6_9BACT|nr:transposase [Persicobacter diffluens]